MQSPYPAHLRGQGLGGYDLMRTSSELTKQAPSLFLRDGVASRLEVRVYNPDRRDESLTASTTPISSQQKGKLSTSQFISTVEDLQKNLKVSSPTGSTKFITIHRMNSWSRMKVTLDVFRTLCSFYDFYPGFLNLVAGMGYKSAPADEHFMTSYSNLQSNEDDLATITMTVFDFCYNVKYFEKHGRDLEDPWSCRQSVVYHRYDLITKSSVWVNIQPPKTWESSLNDLCHHITSHPLILHLRFIRAAAVNFREYLNYIDGKSLELDQRVAFPKPLADYDFDFTLNQELHGLRRKLYRIETILAGSIRNLIALRSHAGAIRALGSVSELQYANFEREISCVLSDLESHKSTCCELLSISSDIKSTINSVLKFRNQEILHKNSTQLQQITENGTQETKMMSEVAVWTYNDSRTTRIATVIALVYLPASLVLSFFSTIFVEIGGSSSESGSRGSKGLVLYNQLWIAIVSIVVLICGTFAAFWIWKYGQSRPRRSTC